MKYPFFLIGFISLVLAAGCAVTPKQISQDQIEKSDPNFGLVVGSYARDVAKERFDIENFYFRKIGSFRQYSIGINALPLVPLQFDFQGEDGYGSLFVFSVPAGNYEFNDFSNIYTLLGGSITLSPGGEYSIPFEVKPGRITYVGEIRIARLRGATILPFVHQDAVSYQINNAQARDIELFKKKYPQNSMEVDVATYDPASGTASIKVSK